MLRRVVGVVVDTHDDCDVLVLRRGGDDDLLGPAVDVRLGLGGVGEEAGRLDDDVGADLAGEAGDLRATQADALLGGQDAGTELEHDALGTFSHEICSVVSKARATSRNPADGPGSAWL